MTRSELIEKIEAAIKLLLEQMSETLVSGGRIEIRGFGSFSVHAQKPRVGRNPRTGETLSVPAKLTLHFKPGKELRERVNGFGDK